MDGPTFLHDGGQRFAADTWAGGALHCDPQRGSGAQGRASVGGEPQRLRPVLCEFPIVALKCLHA